MKVFIIDNYDSFTYNLYQFIGEILTAAESQGAVDGFDITVKRNDQINLQDIVDYNPDRIIVSPGPGSPDDPDYFGVCASVIKELGKTIPLLGVCLGMQGIVHVFGGRIVKANVPMHGKLSPITHNQDGIFRGIPDGLDVMRYHSLIAELESFPEDLEVTAIIKTPETHTLPETKDILKSEAEIMGVKHKTLPIHGIQYHPESFATEGGKEMLKNFLLS